MTITVCVLSVISQESRVLQELHQCQSVLTKVKAGSCPCQVVEMQSKWVLQTILRIFSSPNFEQAIGALQSFLPLSMTDFSSAVMSSNLASALQVWHCLAHASQCTSSASMNNLERVLVTVREVVVSKPLQSYHRPLTRITSMTVFKRLLQECHQLIVAKKLDNEAEVKAQEASNLMGKITPNLSAIEAEKDDGSSFDFQKVINVLQDCFFLLLFLKLNR